MEKYIGCQHTRASIFVLDWKSSSLILLRILDCLKPWTVVLDTLSSLSLLPVKSTVSGFEQEGHETCPMLEEKSIKQDLQKTWEHDVTWNNKNFGSEA